MTTNCISSILKRVKIEFLLLFPGSRNALKIMLFLTDKIGCPQNKLDKKKHTKLILPLGSLFNELFQRNNLLVYINLMKVYMQCWLIFYKINYTISNTNCSLLVVPDSSNTSVSSQTAFLLYQCNIKLKREKL